MARYDLFSYRVTFCLIQGPYVLFLRTYVLFNDMCFTSCNQQLAMAFNLLQLPMCLNRY
jgi:hypothetical protein